MGKMFEVIITSTGKHYLKAEVMTESLVRVPARPSPLPAGAVSGGQKWRESREGTSHSTKALPVAIKRASVCSVDVLLLFSALLVICAGIVVKYSPYFFSVSLQN